jgi:hypothetical protein
MMGNFSKRYLVMLAKYPIATKTVTAGIIAGFADFMAQQIQGKVTSARLDFKRVARMVIFSFAMTPIVHVWYLILARFIQYPVYRVVADQLLFAPASLAAFFILQSFLESGSYTLGLEKMRKSYFGVLWVNYLVWPFICFFNFKYVAPNLQILVMNLGSFLWTIYLSASLNMRDKSDEFLRVAPPVAGNESRESRPGQEGNKDERAKTGDLRRRKTNKPGLQSTGEILTEVEEEINEPVKYSSVPHY